MFDAKDSRASAYFLPLFLFACFSDFLDGFIARKMKTTTVQGAVLDGYADIAIYISAFLSASFVRGEIIRQYVPWLVILFLAQIVSWGFSLVKFGRMTSYHTYSAKIWGATLFISLAAVFAFGSGSLLAVMILAGIICNGEEVLITAVMPYWKAGIPGFRTALHLRNEHIRKP